MSNTVKAHCMGIEYEINRDALNDMDTLVIFGRVNKANEDGIDGDELSLVLDIEELSNRMFGKKQWEKIKEILRKRNSKKTHIELCIQFVFKAVEKAANKLGGDVKN